MANKTVYPYGTGGQLPSSIGIVNDLTTGGVDKALSAEMGKFIGDMISEGVDIETSTTIDVVNATGRKNYIINANNVWAGNLGQSLLIPIDGWESVSVKMNGSAGIIAFLKNNTITTGSTPSFATGESGRRQIASGNTLNVNVPSDANYFYVVVHTSTTEISQNYTIVETTVVNNGGFVSRSDIVDNLNSDDSSAPLSAKQGKLLSQKITGTSLVGKKISIIGDSISCFGTESQTRTQGYNAPYWIVKAVDVGQEIQSWVTWLDVYTSVDSTTPTNKTIGGVTLTSSMIGTKQTFTPVEGDIGKAIGVPRWANAYTTKPWWQVLIDKTGAVLCNNASWSGSRIIPIPSGNSRHAAFVLSEAYSEYTLGRVCNRDDEGNTIVPDVIIIYRGTNDFSAQDPEGGVVSDESESITTPNMLTFNTITDVHNFTQGYIWTIKKLRELYPKAYIVLCTLNIVKRVNYSRFPVNNGTYTLPDYNNKIREIADLMGCGLIEFDKDGITFENCYPTYISDNATTPTHPNTTGHKVMGEKAISDLRYALNY